jgi:hypothetical protein
MIIIAKPNPTLAMAILLIVAENDLLSALLILREMKYGKFKVENLKNAKS